MVRRTHTARLSSTNTQVEVQPLESLAIAAVSGFAEQHMMNSCGKIVEGVWLFESSYLLAVLADD